LCGSCCGILVVDKNILQAKSAPACNCSLGKTLNLTFAN
jgi:hypothetical protein